MFTTRETAELLGYASANVIRVMLKKDMIKGVKKGRDWLIPQEEIDRIKEWRKKAGIMDK